MTKSQFFSQWNQAKDQFTANYLNANKSETIFESYDRVADGLIVSINDKDYILSNQSFAQYVGVPNDNREIDSFISLNEKYEILDILDELMFLDIACELFLESLDDAVKHSVECCLMTVETKSFLFKYTEKINSEMNFSEYLPAQRFDHDFPVDKYENFQTENDILIEFAEMNQVSQY